jgi:hypothetical protein
MNQPWSYGKLFRALLEWRMCSDPWPGGDMAMVDAFLDGMSEMAGFVNWIDAYHAVHWDLPKEGKQNERDEDDDGFEDRRDAA